LPTPGVRYLNKRILQTKKMINIIKKEDLPEITLGIRKTLNLSQSELCKELNLARCTILRWENRKKYPRKSTIKKILDFINKNKLDINELKLIGKDCINGYSKDTTVPKLKLIYSEELAELVGILIGDGEIMKDGTLRIAFDPKKDKNFLYRRVFLLIHNLLGNDIKFESNKRIGIYNIAFVRYLKEDCNLIPGSKFVNNWEIPEWCFEKEEYLSAVLRGLFDTDGYFGYFNGSLELMFGRFSHKCTKLVKNIEGSLNKFNFKVIVRRSKDKRYKIRIQNKKDVIGFFSKFGTSNLKHIVRFLLWRINAYEAKIEIEGLNSLINKTNKLVNMDTRNMQLPFKWGLTEKGAFSEYLKEDDKLIKKRRIIRKSFK